MLSVFKTSFSKLLQGEIKASLFRTTLARGIVVVGSIALITIIGRLYGVSGVGIYALGQSIILTAAQLAKYGMDASLMRYVSVSRSSPQTIVYLRWAALRALSISLILTIGLYIVRDQIGELFQQRELSDLLASMIFAVPSFTIGYILSGFFKGIRKPATASLLENGSVAWITCILIFSFYYLEGAHSLSVIGWSYALASWITMIQGLVQLIFWRRIQKYDTEIMDKSIVAKKEFMTSSHSFFIMRFAQIFQTTFSVIVAGYLLNSYELGLFKASQQLGGLINFILIVINSIYPPYFASMYAKKKYVELQKLARQSSMIGLILAAPMLVLCLLSPNLVLGILGGEFPEAAVLLQIIAVAQLINVATGSVGFLLNMTGHERLMRNISVFSNFIGVLSFFTLIPMLGGLGAAISLAVVLILQNIVALIFVWKRLGIWTLPLPNSFSRI